MLDFLRKLSARLISKLLYNHHRLADISLATFSVARTLIM